MTFLSKLLFWRKPKLSKVEKVALASSLQVPTQAVHDHRSRLRLATLNGLLVSVDPEVRARCEARLADVLRSRGSA